MKYIVLFFLLSAFTLGCEPEFGDTGPEPFAAFIYTEEGTNYLDQTIDEPIEFYIIENGRKLNLFVTRVKFRDSTILNASDTFNVELRARDYYLQVGDDIDTFFIEEKGNEFKTVLFNGEEVEWRHEPETHFFVTKKVE